MDTVIYFALSAAYLLLLMVGVAQAERFGWMRVENILLLVVLALFYDNGIQALGLYIGEGTLLQSLNSIRYLLHALITPLLILFAWSTLVNADLAWAKKTIASRLVIGLTFGSILLDLMSQVWGISLQPAWNNGVLIYEKVNESSFPPLMIIIVTVVLFITSLIIWWKQKWPFYLLGVLSMGLTPVFQHLIKTGAAHNIAELLLMIALLATYSHQQKNHVQTH